ncbi:MAG: hypothetical protein Q8R28_07055 [Dehalococcoidia bacterium]|nr:hypothetical protein [Dehalococcoidia bacterium]
MLTGILKLWAPIAVASTVLCLLAAVSVQQDLRQSANGPQIQMAEDAALAIEKCQAPQSVVPSTTVDIAKRLAAYLIVFDDAGLPVVSSAQLDGQTPLPPSGVFRRGKTTRQRPHHMATQAGSAQRNGSNPFQRTAVWFRSGGEIAT